MKQASSSERQNRNSQLRLSILEYAWSQFTTCGIKPVKVDEIARHFAISKRTLYEMFNDKEELIIECFKYMFEKSEKLLIQLKDESANCLERFVKFFLERIKGIKDVNHVFFMDALKYPALNGYIELAQEKRTQMLMEIIEQCVEEGYLVKDINYMMLFEAYSKQLVNIIRYKLFEKNNIAEMLIVMNVIIFRGCCTEKGIHILDKMLTDYFKDWNKNHPI